MHIKTEPTLIPLCLISLSVFPLLLPSHLPCPPPLLPLSHTSPFLMFPLILPSTPPSKEYTNAHFSVMPLSSLHHKSLHLLLMLVSGLKDIAVQRTKSLIRLDWCFVAKQITQTYTRCIYTWDLLAKVSSLSGFCKFTDSLMCIEPHQVELH